MGHSYAVLGAGRQGTAAAYDIARFGEADRVAMVDADDRRVREAVIRVNSLVGLEAVHGVVADVRDDPTMQRILEDVDVFVSAVPYRFNRDLARVAIRSGASMVDLGGNTEIVRDQLRLAPEARDAGITIVPDCGMGPGLNLTMAAYGMELLDKPEHVFLLDGGLPQDPRPPWSYALTFNVEGLTNEYTGSATFIRKGKLVEVPALTEREVVDFPGIGRLEAMVTSGGLSTAPWSFLGTLTSLENKTLRHPGHWAKMVAFNELGLFDVTPIEVDGRAIAPRHVFHALFGPQAGAGHVRDVCAIQARVLGQRGGAPAEVVVTIVDRFDEATQFTAMERLTGWHAAIVAEMIASGSMPTGAHPVELGVPPRPFMREALRRGLAIDARVGRAEEIIA